MKLLASAVVMLCIASASVADPIQFARAQASSRIPSDILECYTNRTLFERDYRFPSTIQNLIALIQKVEMFDMRAINIREAAKMILKRFRFDGIAYDPEVNPGLSQFTTRFAEPESDMLKTGLIFDMIPGDRYDFPEDSLTQEEKCSLHFMLSHSVNVTKREDEGDNMCQRLNSEWRQRRSVEDNTEEGDNTLAMSQDIDDQEKSDDNTNGDDPAEDDVKEEKEVKDEEGKINKSEITVARAMPSLHNPPAQYRSTKELEELSRCPVELGVVWTRWGPITAGTVIAAIAAGLDVQERSVADLARGTTEIIDQEVGQQRVKNWWAASLAGDVAQVAIFQVPRLHSSAPIVGGTGAWNSTYIPRWYFLNQQEDFEMTGAEIRAGIDGALIANKIREWNNGNLRLSQILEMYYSEKGIADHREYRACKRMDNLQNTETFSSEEFQQQVLNFAYAFYYNASDVQIPRDQETATISEFVSRSMAEFNSAVGRIRDDPCEENWEMPETIEPANTTKVDLYLVLNYDDVIEGAVPNQYELWDFVGELAKQIDVSWWGSSIGIYSAYDGAELIALNATKNAAELVTKLRFIPRWTNGLEVSTVLGKLRERFQQRAAKEEELNIAGSNATVILFVTSNRIADSDKGRAMNVKKEIDYDFPDVKIMFASSVQNTDFNGIVDNYNEDVVRLESGRYAEQAGDVANALSRVHSRLFYPRCSSKSPYYGNAEDSNRFQGAVSPGYIHYFKIDPKYFFSSDNMRIKFETRRSGNLRVCYSRDNVRPQFVNGAAPGGVSCGDTLKGQTSIEFNLHEPCTSDYTRGGCKAVYISVQGLDSSNQCNDQQCRFQDDIVYTYTHGGMKCNGAVSLFMSKQLLLVSLALIVVKAFTGKLL